MKPVFAHTALETVEIIGALAVHRTLACAVLALEVVAVLVARVRVLLLGQDFARKLDVELSIAAVAAQQSWE